MICRLCGYEFDPQALDCHSGCPMESRCSLICCPNCGYQVVDESKSFLARLLNRLGSQKPGDQDREPVPAHHQGATVSLADVPIGEAVQVRRFEDMPPRRLARLSTFGLVPGSRVQVLQRRPAPIVRVGETELALSQEILAQIRVQVETGTPAEDFSSNVERSRARQ